MKKDFFQLGYEAFFLGKKPSDNPYYLTDQKAANEWYAGWLDALMDSEQ